MNIKRTKDGSRFDRDSTTTITEIEYTREDVTGRVLLKTKNGNYVVEHWSQYEGVKETYYSITVEEAKMIVLDNLRWSDALEVFPELATEFKEDI
jgi:hypothetical protein